MPFNKAGELYRDVQDYPFWDSAHVFRVSQAINTVDSDTTKPIVLDESFLRDIKNFKIEEDYLLDSVESVKELFKEGQLILQFTRKHDVEGTIRNATTMILIVYNVDTDNLECYPFSNANVDNKYWPYDLRFFIRNLSAKRPVIKRGAFHPMSVVEDNLDSEAAKHMMSLGAITLYTIRAICSGAYTVVSSQEDLSKLNKARTKKGLVHLKNDYYLIPTEEINEVISRNKGAPCSIGCKAKDGEDQNSEGESAVQPTAS